MTLDCPSCAVQNDAVAQACSACGGSLMTLAVGSVLGSRYDLRAILSEGGIGIVYRAFDRRREAEVAVKVFRTDLPGNAEAVRRFRTEIGRAHSISHPNVGRIDDHGEEGPFGYISMDLLPGEDLQRALHGRPGLPDDEALSAVVQMADGVGALHDAGLTHGDLKTAHAIRDSQGVVRIVPFGMVKDPLHADQSAGGFVGTPEYMSPEHCWGYALDFRSDVYALGILAFEVFTGEVPIRGNGPADTLFKQMREVPKFDEAPGSRMPRRFVPILARALAKTASERFPSAREFSQAWRAEAPGLGIVVPAPRNPPPQPPLPAAGSRDRGPGDARRDERFTLPTDVRIRKLGPGGVPEKEERTIAHDLSRSGMRILTSWSDLATGDQLAIEEVGGSFSTGAIVRHVNRGSDQITRVGIEFLEKHAPDRLVGTTTSIDRPTFATKPPSSPAAVAPKAAPAADRPGPASSPTASRATPRPRSTGATSRPRNTGSVRRSAVTTSFTGPAPRVESGPSHPGNQSPATPTRSAESLLEDIAMARATARELVGESKTWEALDHLAKALVMAQGTLEAHAIRIQTFETQARVPSLMRAAQQNLENLARDDPSDVAVHAGLGRMFWHAGLAARARVAFKHVLSLDPSNREATAALAVLNDPKKRG